jgi:hypothetical protein
MSKANKTDVYSAFKNIEVIHSQLSNITIMMVEFLRLLGLGPADVEKYETEKFWQQKRIYLNRQLDLISRWILTFDPNESSVDSMNETDRLLL